MYDPQKDEDGVLQGFSLGWLRSLSELVGVDEERVLVAMSDGAGFFAALLSCLEQINITELRRSRHRYNISIDSHCPNGIGNFCVERALNFVT